MPQPFRYKRPTKSPKRATVVFDLDHTLICAQHLSPPSPPTNTKHTWTKWRNDTTALQRFPPHSRAFVLSYPPEGEYTTTESLVVHYRPDVIPLLRWCFAHCYVAFWSTGTQRYVRDIVMRLLYDCGQQLSDVLFAWARTPPDASVYNIDKIKFVDVITGTPVQPPRDAMRHASPHKDIGYIFARFPQLSREHIVLVDNLPTHTVGNSPANVLWCPPFTYLNAYDTVLTKMLDALKEIAKKEAAARVAPATETTKKTVTRKPNPSGIKGTPMAKAVPIRAPPPAPVCFSANDLRDAVSTLSPTNNRVQYVHGYVEPENTSVYHIDHTQLKRYCRVVVPYRERYASGTIVKTDRQRGLVHVRVDKTRARKQQKQTARRTNAKSAATSTTKRNAKASGAKNANEVIVVPVAMVTGLGHAHDGELVTRYVQGRTW